MQCVMPGSSSGVHARQPAQRQQQLRVPLLACQLPLLILLLATASSAL